jgi:ribose transport system substrate-binding protein
MKKKITLVLIVLTIISLCLTPLFAKGAKEKKDDQLHFGYIMPGPDPWYGYAKDGFLFAAEKRGVKVTVVNSDYDQEKELANLDDLIAQGLDGINLFSFNPDGAQIAAQMANAANIPLTIEQSALAAGPGQIVSDIEFDWDKLGRMLAHYIAEKHPGENVLEITGIIGQGPVDSMIAAFQEEINLLGKNTLIGIHPADYNREKAMNVMQNMLQSGKEFTVVHVGNEDMAMGVIQVLKDAGLLNNPIKVISNNGSPEGLEAIKNGDLEATISTSPGVEGVVCFEALYRHIQGEKVPKQVMIPMVWIDKTNVAAAVDWEADDTAFDIVNELFESFN